MVKLSSEAKIEDMKHYVKITQEKQPAQVIIHVGTNDLPGNQNSKKTRNNVVVSSIIVSRKDHFNNKEKK